MPAKFETFCCNSENLKFAFHLKTLVQLPPDIQKRSIDFVVSISGLSLKFSLQLSLTQANTRYDIGQLYNLFQCHLILSSNQLLLRGNKKIRICTLCNVLHFDQILLNISTSWECV